MTGLIGIYSVAVVAASLFGGWLPSVVGLTIHQGNFHFGVPRQGVEIQPEDSAEELEKYVGTYGPASFVVEELHRLGLRENRRKRRIQFQGNRQVVHGQTVNRRVGLSKEWCDEVRQEVRWARKHGITAA